MKISEELKDYECLGQAQNGTKLFFHDSNLYAILPDSLKLDELFFCHIYSKYANGSNSYITRDFYLKDLHENYCVYDKGFILVKIKNVSANFSKIEFGQWDGSHTLWSYMFSKRKTIIFQTDHFGIGLSPFIGLRFCKHPNDVAILICPEEKGSDARR